MKIWVTLFALAKSTKAKAQRCSRPEGSRQYAVHAEPALEVRSRNPVQCHLAVLDFGPGSTEGWLTELVGRELGVKQEEYWDARELVLDDVRIGLTALESGVLR